MNLLGLPYAVAMGVLWSVVFCNALHSWAGIGVGICFGISFGLLFSISDKDGEEDKAEASDTEEENNTEE